MMGEHEGQATFYYNMSLEQFVPADHPLRAIRPLIDKQAIRRECRPLYSAIGRPSIPPEQLFLALVGLGLEDQVWDASTFSQNRRRRFDHSGILEKLFDQTVKRAMEEKLISRHLSADGTLVRANASFKSFVPIEVAMEPEEYKKRLRSSDDEHDDQRPQNPGSPTGDFRGQKRSNATHRSSSDPDCRFASKGSWGAAAYPGYTVNALMENRHRILLGLGVEIFRSSTSEEQGALALLDRARRRHKFRGKSLGADKGYFHREFIEGLLQRGIEPHIADNGQGRSPTHQRARMRHRGLPYTLSQRARKLIEELFGEAKEYHGLRRFRRRGLHRVRQEAWLIGWVLNLKRLAKLLVPAPMVA
jgi:transposase